MLGYLPTICRALGYRTVVLKTHDPDKTLAFFFHRNLFPSNLVVAAFTTVRFDTLPII